MAAKNFFLTGAVVGSSSQFGTVDESAVAAASETTGWTVAKIAANFSAELDYGVKQASGSFSAQGTTAKPASFLVGSTANAFRSLSPINGTFDAASWTFTLAVRATTASAQTGRCRLRIFASQNVDGSSSRELTGSTQVGATSAAASTTADSESAVTWTPGTTIILSQEYLFFVIAWEIIAPSGSNSGDWVLRRGSSTIAGTRIATPNFTQARSMIFAPRSSRQYKMIGR